MGLVTNLAWLGGNVTGLSFVVDYSIDETSGNS